MKQIYILMICSIFISCNANTEKAQSQQNSIQKIKREMYETLNQIREDNLKRNPLDKVTLLNVDCTKMDSLLADAYQKDQDSRKGLNTGIVDVDGDNQQLIISLIQNCKWPETKEGVDAIWTVLQHSNAEFISLYYGKLKEFESIGFIDSGTMALMEDRLLMLNDYPQIYGSQVRGNRLYELKAPQYINELRHSVGLEPIEDYTKHFGFEYNVEHYKK